MLLIPFLVIKDVIVTSLLLLKFVEMLSHFPILFDTLLCKYFSLNVYFEGNLYSVNKFNNYDVIMT